MKAIEFPKRYSRKKRKKIRAKQQFHLRKNIKEYVAQLIDHFTKPSIVRELFKDD